MAFVRPKDRVLEKSTTSGSGPYTLPGSGIDTSYNSWASTGISVGDTTLGIVVEPGVAFWSGLVTYSAANQITLTTVYESKGTFGAGTKEIFMGLPAARAVYRNGDSVLDGNLSVGINATITGTLGVGGTNTNGVSLQVTNTSSPDIYSCFTGTAAIGNKGKILFTHLRNSDGAQETLGYLQCFSVDNQSTGGIRCVARSGSDNEVWKATSVGFTLSLPAFTAASVTSAAGLNVPTGVAPTSPASGDIWNDGLSIKARIGSVTKTLSVDQAELFGCLSGLTLSTAGSSSSFAIAAGAANDTAAGGMMVLAVAYGKTTGAWVVGNGANGALDTGTIANNTWYHVFLIKRPDTGVVDVLISLSATAPTLPTNYTLSRRIGSMLTNGSAQWTLFTQTGDTFIWSVTVANSGTAGNGARNTQVVTVPTGILVTALCRPLTTGGGLNNVYISSLQESDQGTSPDLAQQVTGGVASANVARLTNTSAQLGVRANGASVTVIMNTYGWIDSRGK